MPILNTTVFTAAALAISAVLSITAASPAHADDATVRSQIVHLGGLDLNAARDQIVLRHRLLIAATKVCTDGVDTGLNDNAFLECRKVALDQAWSQARILMAAASRSLLAAGPEPARAPPQAMIASAAPPAR